MPSFIAKFWLTFLINKMTAAIALPSEAIATLAMKILRITSSHSSLRRCPQHQTCIRTIPGPHRGRVSTPQRSSLKSSYFRAWINLTLKTWDHFASLTSGGYLSLMKTGQRYAYLKLWGKQNLVYFSKKLITLCLSRINEKPTILLNNLKVYQLVNRSRAEPPRKCHKDSFQKDSALRTV